MFKSLFNGLDKKFRLDILWVGIIQIANYIFPFVTTTYLIRTLQLELFGMTEFATLIILYFITITNFEFHVSGTRKLSQIRQDPLQTELQMSVYLTTKIYLFLVATALFLLLLWAWPGRFYNWLFATSFLIVIGHLLYQPYAFMALGKIRTLAILNFCIKGISTLLIFIFIKSPADYEYVNLNYSASQIIIGGISIYLMQRYYAFKFKWQQFHVVIKTLREGLYIFLTNGILAQFSLNLATIILGLYLHKSKLGSYTGALKIIVALQVMSTLPLKQVFFPAMANLWTNNRKEYLNKFKTYTILLLSVNLLMAVILLIFAPQIIYIAYGDYFPDMIYTLRWLSFSPLLTALLNAYIFDGLLVMGKDRLVFRLQLFLILPQICLLLLFIPRFGLPALLCIKVAFEALTLLSGIIFYYRHLRINTKLEKQTMNN